MTRKSNKQRRTEIVARRQKRADKKAKLLLRHDPREPVPPEEATAPCNPELLASSNSYGLPAFVSRGYYKDEPFKCAGCGSEEIWRAAQQKWWYEVAKGNVESRAKLCRSCRRAERERKAEARRVHFEGMARKRAVAKTRK